MSTDLPPQEPIEPILETNPDARQWGMLCHLSALATLILPSLGNIIGPLIVWLIKKDQYPFVDAQGKEALNFQISLTIYLYASSLILALTCIGTALLIVTIPALLIAGLVFTIIASLEANKGLSYRYPMTIRFLT
jgi:uncharacterized Tic20 family protein